MVFDSRSSMLMCGKARLSKFMATVPDVMTIENYLRVER
jgi:hypothetical protein